MEELYVNLEIREKLIELAVTGKTTTYSRLNTDSDTGYNYQTPADREEFNEDLEAISFSEVKNGRPPLSCLVVFKSGSCGREMLESYYKMCQGLYDLSPETSKPNTKFLKSIQTKCHEYWKISDNYKQFGPRKW